MKHLLSILSLFLINFLQAQNVGIGTNTPLSRLTVKAPFTGITHTDGSTTIATYLDASSGQLGTLSNHRLSFYTNSSGEQMTLLQNGNVGIGTTNPANKLTVLSAAVGSGITNSNGTVNIGTYLNSNSGQFGTISNHRLSLFTNNGAEDVTLLQNGFLGVNTIAPQNQLHINPAGAGGILIGTNKNSGGFTNLEMGITSQSGGNSYIQTTRSSGSAYGDLYLNPSGSYVGVNLSTGTTLFAPLDINQSSSIRGIRLRNTVTPLSTQTWDVFVNNQLHFSIAGSGEVAYIGDDGTYNQVSDARLKTDVVKMETVLEKVMALQPKKYKYRFNNLTGKVASGFIAQEVISIFPEVVSDFKYPTSDTTDNNIYHAINYAGFSVIAIKAIQEQQVQIDKQQTQINTQQQQIDELKLKNDALTKDMELIKIKLGM